MACAYYFNPWEAKATEDLEFETSLDYLASSKTDAAI